MLNLSTTELMYAAMNAAERGDLDSARQRLRDFERAYSNDRSQSEYERLTVLSAIAGVYKRIGDRDSAIKCLQEACSCAESVAPNSAATAGDYSSLAEMRTV